ncbi:MAG TPA: HEAT repeat domain-containing protein [Acidimicrobiales bacterium]|nr:HEAT repeat domain-containing protein [Acidimicrobiales bacterium]
MNGGGVAAFAAAGAALSAAVAISIVARNQVRRRRQNQAHARVRPILFGILDGGAIDRRTIDALDPFEQRALDAQAHSLLPKLRGQEKESLARLLDRRGAVQAAKLRTRSRRPSARAEATEFLGQSGSPSALNNLLGLLNDPKPEVRWAAARGLGEIGDPVAVSPLLGSLEGPRPIPVDVVADAVFKIRDCPISVLRQGLKSQSAPVRAVTVELLGRFQAVAVSAEIIERLEDDPSVEVRARAARALGRVGTPRAIDPLVSSFGDAPVALRAQIVWALKEIGVPEAVPSH